MTFEEQYLTYAEYRQLGGSEIGEMPFNLLEFEARRRIDLKTHNRLVGGKDIPQEVKVCEYELINRIISYASTTNENNGNIANESIDGYSISYVTANQISGIVKSKIFELDDLIKTYLARIEYGDERLLFAGVR